MNKTTSLMLLPLQQLTAAKSSFLQISESRRSENKNHTGTTRRHVHIDTKTKFPVS